MKKYYFMITFVLLYLFKAEAQTNTFPASGNTGIGTSSPMSKLDVVAGSSTTTIRGIGSNAYLLIGNVGSGESYYQANTAHRFQGASNYEALTILGNGRIGINNPSPTGVLSIGNATNSNRVSITDGTAVANMWANENVFNISTETASDIHFYPGANQNSLHLSYNGNVGIGTISPNAKLAVNGNIRAKEVKVETANWPDYVFAKEYELPSLQSTEQQIKDKGHLPGIPSAAEVKANGVDLGEMNAKLLQKIEELTLHLIQQGKEINSLKLSNEKLTTLQTNLGNQHAKTNKLRKE